MLNKTKTFVKDHRYTIGIGTFAIASIALVVKYPDAITFPEVTAPSAIIEIHHHHHS